MLSKGGIMSDKNSVFLTGNLTRDGELKYTSGGMAIGKFPIAVSDSKKNVSGEWENVPSYFDIVCFGKLAERVHSFLIKGARVDISGRMKQERWVKDGENQSRIVINAETVDIIQKQAKTESKPVPPQKNQYPDGESFQSDIPF